MTKRKGITCCCRTDHDGIVLEGYALLQHKGHAVAGVGHRVYCPKCKGIFPIVESVKSAGGMAPAVEGMRTACGARLIPMFDDLWFDDDSGIADLDPPTSGTDDGALTVPSPPDTKGGISSAAFEAARDADKVHVTLRIGIGNDGTGNNFSNSQKALVLCSPEALKLDPKLHPDTIEAMKAACRDEYGMGGASYDGGETNVHRLYNLYNVTDKLEAAKADSDGRLYVYLSVYVQGVGTETGKPDGGIVGSGMGYGPTGVVARAKEAVDAVVAEVRTFVEKNPNIIIDAIEFDLWGFSRGAAATRHLAWLISHGKNENLVTRTLMAPPNGVSVGAAGTGIGGAWAVSPAESFNLMDNALHAGGLPLKPGFSKHDLTIRFIGLFDCVAAMGIPSDADNDPVHLSLPSGIGTVVHLAARDECRLNFASNPVKPYNTTLLPGAHSDIGGGYPMLGWEHLILGEPETSARRIDDRWPPSVTQSDAWRRAFTQMLDYGWSDHTLLDNATEADKAVNQLRIECWTHTIMKRGVWGSEPQPWQTVTAAVTLRRKVRGEYQLIPLRIMYELAKEAGVPFSKSPDEVPELSLPSELVPIHQKLLAYARSGGRGKTGLTQDEEWLLSRRYVHQSANWNPKDWKPAARPTDKDPVPQAAATLLFFMRPAPDRKRNVFDPPRGH